MFVAVFYAFLCVVRVVRCNCLMFVFMVCLLLCGLCCSVFVGVGVCPFVVVDVVVG